MNFRFSTLALGALLSALSFHLNAQGFGVVLDSVEAETGKVVCLPVRAQGFDGILSFQYSLTWDAQVLAFDGVQNYNLPGLVQDDFFNLSVPSGLLIGWSDPSGSGVSKLDGHVCFEVCFTVVGPVGSSTAITPGSVGFPAGTGGAEAYDGTFTDLWDAALNVPGYVEVTPFNQSSGTSGAGLSVESLLKLAPNPTHASAQVFVQSPASGAATLSVTDALGRAVFEQKTTLKAGENIFEIPAEALKAKGMYQVLVKTERGVSSQMLSVH
ncbi:MAG: T9SS type A sorting domain-containing protein [Saprospiraceae bacterium]